MKIRKGLQLRKIGSRYMVVDACADNVNMSKVYSMNQTAANIWHWLEEGTESLEELADKLCQAYEVDRDRALRDVEKQLADWQAYGLLVAE